ncbi:MAG: hypothetical protein O2820_24605 [Planctomycetota bacterium]|nr:hypothetical protein [Planctomycetota bacterium]MDA1252396.1 hypothetical protein [Planctomycetota bacterium]
MQNPDTSNLAPANTAATPRTAPQAFQVDDAVAGRRVATLLVCFFTYAATISLLIFL